MRQLLKAEKLKEMCDVKFAAFLNDRSTDIAWDEQEAAYLRLVKNGNSSDLYLRTHVQKT